MSEENVSKVVDFVRENPGKLLPRAKRHLQGYWEALDRGLIRVETAGRTRYRAWPVEAPRP